MGSDSHDLWRVVAGHYEALGRSAPEGYRPAVDVYLSGRGEPVRLARVRTVRDPEFAWTLLSAESSDDDAEETMEDDYLVLVREEHVERVEVRYVRAAGPPVGFTHEVVERAALPAGERD